MKCLMSKCKCLISNIKNPKNVVLSGLEWLATKKRLPNGNRSILESGSKVAHKFDIRPS